MVSYYKYFSRTYKLIVGQTTQSIEQQGLQLDLGQTLDNRVMCR